MELVVLVDQSATYRRTSSSAIRRSLVALLDLVPLQVLRRIVNDDALLAFYRSVYDQKDVRPPMLRLDPALAIPSRSFQDASDES